ncbi:MAG: hypothetical protein IPM32_14445 [Ignavibacteriae bacterium]|nr:hypothetical protein [Ignavibacteriota bacterium]
MKYFISIVLLFILAACSTYTIPVQSFREQFKDIDTTDFKIVQINIPLGTTYAYTEIGSFYPANPIENILCYDGENQISLKNGPSIEIRFTDKNDDSKIFYFDTVYLKDSLIVGAQSRYFPTIRDTIKLNNVKLIEVQDGKKQFYYIEK